MPFLESFVQLILKRKTQYVSPKTTFFSLKYLFYSLKIEKTFSSVHNILEKILFEYLIPLLYLTPKDAELWNNGLFQYFFYKIYLNEL